MAPRAQGDQIPFGIITEPAARLNVMHLEFASSIRNAGSATRLASIFLPTVCGKRRDQAVGVDVLSQETSCGLPYLIQEFLPFEFR